MQDVTLVIDRGHCLGFVVEQSEHPLGRIWPSGPSVGLPLVDVVGRLPAFEHYLLAMCARRVATATILSP